MRTSISNTVRQAQVTVRVIALSKFSDATEILDHAFCAVNKLELANETDDIVTTEDMEVLLGELCEKSADFILYRAEKRYNYKYEYQSK